MRPNGNRYWLRSAGQALLLALAIVALGAAPAAADDRYATASGGVTFGICDTDNACTLKAAIEGASYGDTVHVKPGNYSVSQPIESLWALTVTGGTSNNTTITGLATLAGGPVLQLD